MGHNFFFGTITLWAISRDILRGPRLFWPLNCPERSNKKNYVPQRYINRYLKLANCSGRPRSSRAANKMQKIYYLKVRYKLNIWILTYFWNLLTILYFILEFGGVVRNESYTVYKYILSEKSVILFPVTGRWWCTFTGMMNLSVSQYEDVYLVPCCVASVQTAAVSVSYQSRKLLYLWKKERKIPYSVTDKSGSQWCILEKNRANSAVSAQQTKKFDLLIRLAEQNRTTLSCISDNQMG